MAAVEQRKTTSRSQDRNFRRQQDLVAHLSSTTIAFNQLKAQIRELFKDGRSFAEVVYQSPDISVLASYFNILHTFSLARRDSETRNLIKNQQKVLEAVDRDDIYTYPIRSVSLEDVNKLSRPLSLGHIGIINKFLRLNRIPYFPWIPVDKEAQPAMSVAMMLPALDVARPKEVVIPSVLEGLRDNMQAYLDYYLGFINPTHLDDDQSFQLYKVLAYMGRTLPMALGLYMPARLGVTPSSSMKLLLEKEVFGGSKLGWFAIRRDMESEIKHAFRKDGLPAAVQPYQHYNHHADREAATIFIDHYQSDSSRRLTSETESGGQETLLGRFSRYHKALRSDVLNDPERCLTLSVDEGPIKKIILANQYRSSMMLVVLLDDNGDRYLTLDVNQTRLYGLPADLLREVPHVDVLLGKDVFEPVLEFARQRHPNIEPRPVIKVVNSQLNSDQKKATEEAVKPVKIKRRRLPGVLSLVKEPTLPEPVKDEELQPVSQVLHTGTEIAKLMKRNTGSDDLRRVMEAIYKFEMGLPVDIKHLTDIPGYLRLRVGRWRIIIHELDVESEFPTYELDEISRKDDSTSLRHMRKFGFG